MAYNLWYSEKAADMNESKTEAQRWTGQKAWTDIGYAIAADKDGNLIQYMDAGDRVSAAIQSHDRHAYIVATAREKEDFRVLVNRKGEINEALAAELDIKADLDVIKSLVPRFYEPKPNEANRAQTLLHYMNGELEGRNYNFNPMKDSGTNSGAQEFTFRRPALGAK